MTFSCLAPEVSHHPVAPVCQVQTLSSKPTTTTPAPTTTTALSCPDGWTEFQNNCYLHIESNYYWTNADAYCLARGARLASVHSKEGNDFLETLAGGNSFWIGGYPQGSTWVWSDFSEYDYEDFYSSSAGECLYQYSSHYGNGWNTDSCTSDSHYFTCKLMKF